MAKVLSFYKGKDAREVPLYAAPHVAHYLRVPASTIRDWAAHGLIHTTRDGMLSFNTLTEAYVLATLRRECRFSMVTIRSAVEYLADEFRHRRPLLSADISTDGKTIFVNHDRAMIDVSKRKGQRVIVEAFMSSLRRIDRDAKGAPQSLSPYLEVPSEQRLISIDPRRSFGRPVIEGTSILVDVIAERFHAGDSKKELMADYKLQLDKVNAAIQWNRERKAA
jgi:uncharacterized protein (DUF433 family)